MVTVIERQREAGELAPAPLLVPGYLPALRLRWFSLVLVAGFSGLGLWTSPRALAQSSKGPETVAEQPIATGDKFFLTMVKVITEDGTAVGRDAGRIYTHHEAANGSGGASVGLDESGTAAVWVQEDSSMLAICAVKEGYAPAFAGPFAPPTREKMANLQLKLTKGFSASIQVHDDAGEPIAGATLQAYYPGPPAIDADRLTKDAFSTTDASGLALLTHLGTAPLNVRVKADGFQADEVAAPRLDPARPYRWGLKRARSLPGLVVATATGQPIPGAKIKLAGVRGPHDETYFDPAKAPLLTTADEQGRFALTSLRPDSRYYFFVEAPGYSGAFLPGIQPGAPELKVTLGPELVIRGKIVNAQPPMSYEGKVYLDVGQNFQFGANFAGEASQQRILSATVVAAPRARETAIRWRGDRGLGLGDAWVECALARPAGLPLSTSASGTARGADR